MNGLIEIELGMGLSQYSERLLLKSAAARLAERQDMIIAALWRARLEGVVIALQPATDRGSLRADLYMDALHELALIEEAGI